MFGISRQAYYKRLETNKRVEKTTALIIDLIKHERKIQHRAGTKKVYKMIKPKLKKYNIKIGRDRLFDIARTNDLLIARKKNFHKTTNSNHRFYKYPNLIKELVVTQPEQVWVSDITYIKTEQGFEYLSLITDLYSKQIMGYYLSDNLKTENTLKALELAIKNRKYPNRSLIHHSDRGFQYCSEAYTNKLISNGIQISMTQSYDPYENAVAERVNGILKDEFSIADGFINHAQAVQEIKRSIEIYNTHRLHISCDYLTPSQAHAFGKYKLKKWGRLSTNKHILTKEKRSKKENNTTNNSNFN